MTLWSKPVPKWAKDNWWILKRVLLEANEDWDVWTEWYEARLNGATKAGFPHEALELARVQIAGRIWRQGPKVVNARIKKLIEQFETSSRPLKGQVELPTIPAQRRAAVEPVWLNGRLTIPTVSIAVDLKKNEFPAALQALRAGLQKFAADIDGEANIDHRFVSYVHDLAEQIPNDIPPQHVLFELGHAEEVFIQYAPKVNEQWPDILAARFHAMARQHDNTMRQAPAWREFKRNALRDSITPQQVAEVAPVAAQVAEALQSNNARSFVDETIPRVLNDLAELLRRPPPPPEDISDEWRRAIEESNELLAMDVIESINNTLKRLAEVAVATGAFLGEAAGNFGGGAKEAALKASAEEGRKFGTQIVRWLRIGGTVGLTVALQQLITTYPHTFGWLGSVLQFLAKLPTQ